ncbi:Ribosomal protein S6 kinase alpha-5 [Phlyctochytrium bullatum]|nr:Ribosomal protein S6 kinase alpha-5 [Phlyctochytrium bullatum]
MLVPNLQPAATTSKRSGRQPQQAASSSKTTLDQQRRNKTNPAAPIAPVSKRGPSGFFEDDPIDTLKDKAKTDSERRALFAIRFAVRNSETLRCFKIRAILGSGGLGVVLAAELLPGTPMASRVGQSLVAIKISYKWTALTYTADPESQDLKPEEDSTMLALASKQGHPNIMRYITSWSDSRHFYTVMELASDEFTPDKKRIPLNFVNHAQKRSEWIPFVEERADVHGWYYSISRRHHPLREDGGSESHPEHPPIAVVQGMFAQMVKAVHHLHVRGIVHGDLKPSNFLVGKYDVKPAKDLEGDKTSSTADLAELAVACSPRILLCDFGHANKVVENPVIYRYGTPGYNAPELQVNLSRLGTESLPYRFTFTRKAEVFALGLTLVFMLEGHEGLGEAFKKASEKVAGLTEEDFRQNRYPWKCKRDIPQECRELLDAMLSLDPKRRPTIKKVIKMPWVKNVLDAEERMKAAGKPVWGMEPDVSTPIHEAGPVTANCHDKPDKVTGLPVLKRDRLASTRLRHAIDHASIAPRPANFSGMAAINEEPTSPHLPGTIAAKSSVGPIRNRRVAGPPCGPYDRVGRIGAGGGTFSRRSNEGEGTLKCSRTGPILGNPTLNMATTEAQHFQQVPGMVYPQGDGCIHPMALHANPQFIPQQLQPILQHPQLVPLPQGHLHHPALYCPPMAFTHAVPQAYMLPQLNSGLTGFIQQPAPLYQPPPGATLWHTLYSSFNFQVTLGVVDIAPLQWLSPLAGEQSFIQPLFDPTGFYLPVAGLAL